MEVTILACIPVRRITWYIWWLAKRWIFFYLHEDFWYLSIGRCKVVIFELLYQPLLRSPTSSLQSPWGLGLLFLNSRGWTSRYYLLGNRPPDNLPLDYCGHQYGCCPLLPHAHPCSSRDGAVPASGASIRQSTMLRIQSGLPMLLCNLDLHRPKEGTVEATDCSE
jgi:hypothetical protein